MTNSTQECDTRTSIVVIGGGIAGIATAIRLRSLAPSARITLVEGKNALGGKIVGDTVDGCIIDGGADVCIGDKLCTTHLFISLDLALHAIRANPNRLPTYELRDGYLHRLPTTFTGELLTFPGGMRELVDHASRALDGIEVSLNTHADSLEADGRRWRVGLADAGSLLADAVVVAAPAGAAAALIPGIPAELTSTLRALEYPLTTTVTMAWRRRDVPHPLNATGYLVADSASAISACTFTSAKIPSHAPTDIALVRCYVRGDADDPAALMRDEVGSVLGVSAPPLLVRVYRWTSGIPLYTPSHTAAVRSLDSQLQSKPGLYVAGSAFHGVGIPDCILSGERAAESVVSYLIAGSTEAAA